ncbi:MAG: two component, sigma54 specific, transcriptional regulator, Fis family, partial [Cyanobacteria bacterium RYN_339]|nr:two component, sigma54 specific, transcriptional regulator, Fis family [Cyanobacteria bacterium RYN_339]
ARAAAERAALGARAAQAPAVLVQALNMQGLLLIQADPAQAPAAIAMLQEALAIARGLGDRAGMALVLDNLGNAHLATGDLYGARRAFAIYADHCRDAGFTTEALAAALNQALVAAERGDTAAALAFAETAERAADKAGRRFILAAALAARGQALVRRGEPAGEVLDRALALADAIGNRMLEELVRLVRLEALLAAGEDAGPEIALLEPIVVATGHAEAAAKLACARAEQALRDQQLAAARVAVAPALTSPNRVAAHRAHQLLAEIALAEGQAEAALVEALAALAIATAWDAPWHLAADRSLAARARLMAGDDTGARADARWVVGGDAPPGARAAMAALVPAIATTAGGLDLARYGRWIEALALAGDEGAIAATALDGVLDLVGGERGYLIGYVDGRIGQIATRGIDYATEVATGFSQTMVQRVLYAGAPLYVADASTDADWREVASVMALELRAVVCLPLATPDAILGVIYVDRRDLEPAISDGDLALLAAFATAAASALQREGRRADAQAGYELVAGLAARLLAASPELVAAELLAAARELVGAERGFWLVPTATGWDAIATQGDATEPPSQGILAHVSATGGPLGIIDLQEDEEWQERRSVQALGLRSVWCLPTGAASGALLYLDTTQAAMGDPADRLQGLEALLRAAGPLL